jgi:haloacid dehalogenase superfamily, subfamily IA, variant 1 with third motif having Dx(3-4)D or Dx(3-4)E
MPRAPRALLLDFGGVLVDEPVQRGRSVPMTSVVRVTSVVRERLAAAGAPVPDTLDADLAAGLTAYGHYCEAMVRPSEPVEPSHHELWTQYVAADWPAAARTVVAEQASQLCYQLVQLDDDLPLRPGTAELLADAAARGIPLAIVSNTVCGARHRDYLASVGIGTRFAVQLYSDEAGIRKPHPELVRRAAKVVEVPVEECWYVGDTWSRDVRCGRRAGVGTTVLMHSSRTGTETAPAGLRADIEVADPVELHATLTAAWT